MALNPQLRTRGPHNPLRAWQRQAIDGTGALLLASGVVWLMLHYGNPDALPHPLQAWLLRLHGLAAFAALFMFGLLAATHVPRGWRVTARGRDRRDGQDGRDGAQRRWGLALCVLAALLVASAYLLYYFAPENLRPALGGVHSAAGGAMGLALWAHRRAGRRGPRP